MQNLPVRRTPWATVVSLVLALLYGVSPIDLVPDVLPLVGWLDDGVVMGLLVLMAAVFAVRRRRAARRATPVRIPR